MKTYRNCESIDIEINYPPHEAERWRSTDGFGDKDTTNGDRANDAKTACRTLLNDEDQFSDLICNLLHLAHEYNLYPGTIIKSAINNFNCEAGELPFSLENEQ
jgi:hypothetical protein